MLEAKRRIEALNTKMSELLELSSSQLSPEELREELMPRLNEINKNTNAKLAAMATSNDKALKTALGKINDQSAAINEQIARDAAGLDKLR